MSHRNIELLIDSLNEAYRGPAWHGPSLRAALRGLDGRQATLRPGAGRHNCWELAVHAAFWKYAVRRRLVGGKQAAFPHPGSNFFERPSREETASASSLAKAWKQDLALLDKAHEELCATVAALSPASLNRPSRGHRQTPRFMIEGIAMHDVYHAGQIQLLRRLLSKR
jgi:hypothetical protein